MPHTVTITAKTGPDLPVAARTYTLVTRVDFDLARKMVQIYQLDQPANTTVATIKEYDLSTVATVTCVIATGNYTFTLA